ncbi:hypothetical protein [Candidatus Oleimmundimicrobium sp.]|uniref:hypothetical protein n=1 Tax=Candidatus Oleimmundimicrobium sp. TaxID=3060597 RepID=UPI0027292D3A|nr:hypothetical protein [Candidatus Oleimmundimicrobium sp.]MDO8886447.1 hypothetical protein [Candidatus Oleimmundimicrobium sp.]
MGETRFLENLKGTISLQLKSEVSKANNLAIGEIAGRDSIAAIIKAFEEEDIDAVLSTVVHTGTEYGDYKILEDNVKYLRKRLSDLGLLSGHANPVLNSITLGEPALWHALNGRFLSVLFKRFGFCPSCLGCHLYMHLIRAPLAWRIGADKIISGERKSHAGNVKINQLPVALDAYKEVLNYAGVELLFPLREVVSNDEIESLIGSDWEQGKRQLKCTLSGNYRTLDDEVEYDEDALKKYFDEFAAPASKEILKLWKEDKEVDYIKVVKEVLEG